MFGAYFFFYAIHLELQLYSSLFSFFLFLAASFWLLVFSSETFSFFSRVFYELCVFIATFFLFSIFFIFLLPPSFPFFVWISGFSGLWIFQRCHTVNTHLVTSLLVSSFTLLNCGCVLCVCFGSHSFRTEIKTNTKHNREQTTDKAKRTKRNCLVDCESEIKRSDTYYVTDTKRKLRIWLFGI